MEPARFVRVLEPSAASGRVKGAILAVVAYRNAGERLAAERNAAETGSFRERWGKCAQVLHRTSPSEGRFGQTCLPHLAEP